MDHFTQVKAAEDIKCQRQNPSQVVEDIYETTINTILKFPFKNGTSLTINVQVLPENSLKTLPLWFLFRTGQAFLREEANQVEVLEDESVFS